MNKAQTSHRTFRDLVDSGDVTEVYSAGCVTITCVACGERWMRGRHDGRQATIDDRAVAVLHVASGCATREWTIE